MGDFALQFLDEVTTKKDPFLLYVAFNARALSTARAGGRCKKMDGAYDAGWDACAARVTPNNSSSGSFQKNLSSARGQHTFPHGKA